MKALTFFGIAGTALYLVFLLAISYASHESFEGKGPNEWGDFLAGTVGPLALIWIVIGYFQQGEELRNSVNTLQLQTKELKNSVDQQREIARIANEQFALQQNEFTSTIQRLETENCARFVILYLGVDLRNSSPYDDMKGSPELHKFEIANIGNTAVELSIWPAYGEFSGIEDLIVIWPQFKTEIFYFPLFREDTYGNQIQINLNYKESTGKAVSEEYYFARSLGLDNSVSFSLAKSEEV
jgi:hypothetical protein